MKLRTSDPNHQYFVGKWLDHLMPKIVPLLYGNGGPIIMVQVENEYGSYYACDRAYTIWLRNKLDHYVQGDAVLFTTDGGASTYLKCGVIPGVLITVDFGSGANVSNAFEAVKRAGQPNGPFINSEYYTGWLTRWNEPLQEVKTESVIKTLREILEYANNTSVNLYMFFGGTNYAFTSGANCNGGGAFAGYVPQLTSYDYDAPISEGGDLTDKYFAIKNVVKQYIPGTNLGENKTNTTKANYGTIQMEKAISFFDIPGRTPVIESRYPMSFEDLYLSYGFVLYKHLLSDDYADPAHLYVPGLRDRAVVCLDQKPVGILSRFRNIFTLPLMAKKGQMLSLLVENQGRMNYGNFLNDTKGIVCNVLLDGQPLLNWEMPTYPFNNITEIEALYTENPKPVISIKPPAVYTGFLNLYENKTVFDDTYLNLEGWGKGVAFINGFNLGRYWVTTGPQVTLYVPGCVLRPNRNIISIFELEIQHPYLEATFQPKPILNKTVPKLGRYGAICEMQCKIIEKAKP